MPQIEGRDPALWWLDFDLPDNRRHETILAVVRVRDYWLMTTDRAVWKFSVNHDGTPRVILVQELYDQ